MLGTFLRENGLLTILIFLLIILASNVGLILQNKGNKNKSTGWDTISKSSELLKDPWKKENDQWQELSDKVAALKEHEKDKPE
jgi:hypothetical protein